MSRIILCLDMDTLFTPIAQKTNTGLRGRPKAIIGLVVNLDHISIL